MVQFLQGINLSLNASYIWVIPNLHLVIMLRARSYIWPNSLFSFLFRRHHFGKKNDNFVPRLAYSKCLISLVRTWYLSHLQRITSHETYSLTIKLFSNLLIFSYVVFRYFICCWLYSFWTFDISFYSFFWFLVYLW